MFANGLAAYVGTTQIGNLGGIISDSSSVDMAGVCFGAVFGTGGNLVSAGVNAGISKKKPQLQPKPIQNDHTLHIYKPTGYRQIGMGRTYNGKTGRATTYKIYRSDSGHIFYKYV